jgi:signal transduction histidine kinase
MLSLWETAGVWALVAVIFIGQNVSSSLTRRRQIDWQWDVVHELIYWSLWALSTPIIARTARRQWIEPGSGLRPWLAHLATAIVLIPVQIGATYLIHGLGLVTLGSLEGANLGRWLMDRSRIAPVLGISGFLYYWLIVGGYYALAYRRLYLVQRAQTAEATLAALRAQLQPHFLFNTLNSIAVLVEESPAAARRVLLRLSELLRTVLKQDPRHEVPLEEELAFIDRYLEIQKVRFEDRLDVSLEIEPAARRALVPSLVLQPLIENAIRHAIEPRVQGGRVRVRAGVRDDRLSLEVTDDGPGLEASSREQDGSGIGIANTRARLERLYGDRHGFRIAPGEAGGVSATITIPYREA